MTPKGSAAPRLRTTARMASRAHTHTLKPTEVRNSMCAKDSFGHCPVYLQFLPRPPPSPPPPLSILPSLRNLTLEATHCKKWRPTMTKHILILILNTKGDNNLIIRMQKKIVKFSDTLLKQCSKLHIRSIFHNFKLLSIKFFTLFLFQHNVSAL